MAIEVGQKASRTMLLTMQHVRRYAELTGDFQAVSFDPQKLAGPPQDRPPAPTWLLGALLHTVVAMDLPGPGSAFLEQRWRFPAQARIGDTITGQISVVGLRDDDRTADLAMVVKRTDGAPVLEGEALVALPSATPPDHPVGSGDTERETAS